MTVKYLPEGARYTDSPCVYVNVSSIVQVPDGVHVHFDNDDESDNTCFIATGSFDNYMKFIKDKNYAKSGRLF